MSRTAHFARLERERLIAVDQTTRRRAEARATAAGVRETVTLSAARGARFEGPAGDKVGREQPYRRLAGLDWLARKGRLTTDQLKAGEAYGDCYRKASAEAALGSSLAALPGSGQGTPITLVVRQAEARAQAAAHLAMLRGKLGGQADLIAACDHVCGRELTPREAADGEREAGRLEAVLRVALDLMSGPSSP
ncbi:hypothetical protein [Phenylobacterium aquaticum]|uniref:hypothetical protein n=1 Tax=Phenylobacterium aquaticum TaxID=1763816 RepID=UPI0026ED630D|nr:hypothetical protein [Phenylobacterium aquaticum]